MTNFEKRACEILEGLKPLKYSPILKGVSKVIGAPKKLDQALTSFFKGEMPDTISGGGVEKPSGAIEPEYSDLEKELILVLKKLKLNPRDPRLKKRADELRAELTKR